MLFCSAGSASAIPISVMDELTGGDFIITEQNGGPLGNGIDERTLGEFDLTALPNLANYDLTRAQLTLRIIAKQALVTTDEINFGSVKTGDNNLDQAFDLGYWDLFVGGDFPTLGLPVPTLNVETELTINLLDLYAAADFLSIIEEGTYGKVWFKWSDDVTLTYAKLEVGGEDYNNYDNHAPVPEPSTMILLGSGLMALVAWRRKTHQ